MRRPGAPAPRPRPRPEPLTASGFGHGLEPNIPFTVELIAMLSQRDRIPVPSYLPPDFIDPAPAIFARFEGIQADATPRRIRATAPSDRIDTRRAMPAPTRLPSLSDALSRRAALLGAAASAGALAASTGCAPEPVPARTIPAGPLTLADLRAIDVPALWAALSAEQQAEIGTAAVARELAMLVAASDGPEGTEPQRRAASNMAAEATDGLAQAIEDAMPAVAWWPP